ncbi:unnamed protein product [Acanthoscelides obtectus]|uniref:MADF domain-containing protein n=1 Tax=Acanthoscelides obtectus TaxID=200917 RepID=A0A9P0KD78_ACAOB|nr:unnamed protein product [Acanthoscelides obtectus]CAK1635769.1 hypothetical protein AOBTE_LOCUS9487 [Acanthoscelides obtectus]
METTAEQCKKKIISLLASFRREKNKTKQGTTTGKGRDEVYCSRWFAYEAFRFLEDRDLPRKRLATELDDVNEAALSSEQMEQEAIPETPTLPSTSKSTKRSKTKQDNVSSPIMSDAFQILKNAAKKMDKEPTQPSVIDLFFNFVAAKVQKYPPPIHQTIQHAVFDLIIKADRGFLNPTSIQSYNDSQPTSYIQSQATNHINSQPTSSMYSQPTSHNLYSKSSETYYSQPLQVITVPSTSEPSLSNPSSLQSPVSSLTSENYEDFV